MPSSLPPFGGDEAAVSEQPVQANWEDVDMNGHVNNVNAVGWCLTGHDFEFLNRWRPEFLEANFLAEMFCGQQFVIRRRELPAEAERKIFDYVVVRETDQTATLRLRISFR